MQTAKIFITGRSQAVRLPKDFRFDGDEVFIKHFYGGVLLLPKDGGWKGFFQALDEFEPGFELVREQPEMQEREDFL
ncbi:type II toxin-antitoxin system VapB family antitoxin [Neisseria leonii]|uniref:Type II toxin-antitoxin system VapB family antitoxin n=1 Tax=Neisseria leonii TaxID=2995413 RepID=A0A9X4DZN7_9NEIS|nr:type II toxin-antitoxin system VapB family antitoxin [Neisseria sp. 51.81]MDD9326721.1 type II toxin-antitoxin system VapB family antitoxin [Neisseria sp. 51.81]